MATARKSKKKTVSLYSKAKKKLVAKSKPVILMIGTRKGAFFLRGDGTRKAWTVSKPILLGHIIYHIVSDPRNPKVIVMATKTGHLGPTIHRSIDGGKTWVESKKPPAFPAVTNDEKARAVDNVFWLSAGHASEPRTWWAGTAPAGLFVSKDDGDTWEPVSGFNEHPKYKEWMGIGPTPAGQIVHSIRIDPRDPRHMYLGVSVGGVFETMDQGASWKPLNKGCSAEFLPDPNAETGHDPHCLIIHPLNPDRLYQQNHCGIYRLDRPSDTWIRIGNNMPKQIGDIGFPIVAHPRNQDNAWVFPMDGTTVWPRTSVDGKPAAYMTTNGGKSWKRLDNGFPARDAYFTVKRQAMCDDNREPLGLYLGTSGGEVWASKDEGKKWSCLVRYLPEIYSLTIME